ncbi:MAG: hypothetical protein JWQ98_397 [Chlorobi bacterium]|nr:hypothetical protein [Chlorobiota bacterium]
MDHRRRCTIITMLALICSAGTLAAQPRPDAPVQLEPLIDDSLRFARCDSVAIMREMIAGLWLAGWNGHAKNAMKERRKAIDSIQRDLRRIRMTGDEPNLDALPGKFYSSWRETRDEKLRLLLWTTSITADDRTKTDVTSIALVWASFRDTTGRRRWALGRELSNDTSDECHRWRIGFGSREGRSGGDGMFVEVEGVPLPPTDGNGDAELPVQRVDSDRQDSSVINDSIHPAGLEMTVPRERLAAAELVTRFPAIQTYDHPPTNADIYLFLGDSGPHPGDPNAQLWTWGVMNRRLGTRDVDGQIRGVAGKIWREHWREAVGEYPTREFKYLEREE